MMDKLLMNSPEHQMANIPYRHEEVVRVEECRSCEKRQQRNASIARSVNVFSKYGSWATLCWIEFGRVVEQQPHTGAMILLLGGFGFSIATIVSLIIQSSRHD
jgi:hypothetical protein